MVESQGSDGAVATFLKYGLPWVFYVAGFYFGYPTLGNAAAFLLILAICLKSPRRIKAVEVVLALFFLLMAIEAAWRCLPWILSCQAYLAPALLAAMALGSLVIGLPFSLPYAKERSPSSMWNNPHFLLVNRVITALWGLAFLACAWLKAENRLSHALALMLCFGLMFLAALFTKWFPEWYRREIYLKKYGEETF